MVSWAKLLAVLAAAACVGMAVCQTGKPSSKPKSTGPISAGAVTVNEFREVFYRLEEAMRKSLGGGAVIKPAKINPDAPVNRETIILKMNALVERARPLFKFTPLPIGFEVNRLAVPPTSSARKPLEALVRGGFIARVGPLATSKRNTLAVNEFVDAVGYFFTRIGELTHMPDAKFSPSINGNNEDAPKRSPGG